MYKIKKETALRCTRRKQTEREKKSRSQSLVEFQPSRALNSFICSLVHRLFLSIRPRRRNMSSDSWYTTSVHPKM